jgi:hypothetical protein
LRVGTAAKSFATQSEAKRTWFRFTGKINKLTFKLWPTQLTSNDHQIIQHALATARD